MFTVILSKMKQGPLLMKLRSAAYSLLNIELMLVRETGSEDELLEAKIVILTGWTR